jgi:RNA polymerase sigma factor (TIGR02999 family)
VNSGKPGFALGVRKNAARNDAERTALARDAFPSALALEIEAFHLPATMATGDVSGDSRPSDSGASADAAPTDGTPGPGEITRLLHLWHAGDTGALPEVAGAVYGKLRAIARQIVSREWQTPPFEAAELVHEVFLRLQGCRPPRWKDRTEFFRTMARVMRQVLVDAARARRAQRRGGGVVPAPIDAVTEPANEPAADPLDLLALDEALARLAALDARQAEIVELRYFAQFSVEETARALGVSLRTVKRDWAFARAWLARELKPPV